jgi:glycogen(starch) synthase
VKACVRICVCTSYGAAEEPRAPRHAAAIAAASPAYDVIFVDCVAVGQPAQTAACLETAPRLRRITLRYPTRRSAPRAWAIQKIRHLAARGLAHATGSWTSAALSPRGARLERALNGIDADVYIGYNIDALLPIFHVAQKSGAAMIFDSMEFHSDMGADQTPDEQEAIRRVERLCLPACDLVLAPSRQLADALSRTYGIGEPLVIRNVPPLEPMARPVAERELALYWRNRTIGLGPRGLEDVLVAMTRLPRSLRLHIQGGPAFDRGDGVRRRIDELGLSDRVVRHPSYRLEEAVAAASHFRIGLCPERAASMNQQLTVGSKIFDFFMAGLAVVASELPGLQDVVERSRGGLLFRPGSPDDLAAKILRLYDSPALLGELSGGARAFAESAANLEAEMQRLTSRLDIVIGRRDALEGAGGGHTRGSRSKPSLSRR